jgi:hypothetical protein
MLFLNSPTRILIFACFVFIVAASGIWLINQEMKADGLPVIEASIDKQLGEIMNNSPNLKDLLIGAKSRRHVRTSRLSVTGFFLYEVRSNASPVELRVDWKKDSSGCEITSVELLSQDASPKLLWAPH